MEGRNRAENLLKKVFGVEVGLKVTIDFNKVPALTAGTDADNGLQNTWDIYTFQGVNEASALMAQL
ncbi:MAG: hypothetical protein UHP27_07825 [Muribaculaceae bacterium]|nr:hypothetical protein [Muribaculaceae bacterium]